MAKRTFLVDIDLQKNQMLNMVLQNLSTHPATVGLPQGFTYYNTADGTTYTWTGVLWLDLGLVSNLSLGTVTTTTVAIAQNGVDDVVLPAATTSLAGVMTSADKTKLNGIGTGASVSNFSAGDLNPLFTTSVATPTTTPTLSFILNSSGANTWFGNATASATTPSFNAAGTLTRTNDTNVTLTLGGTPTSSLLKSVSMTLGWTGSLSTARGGTGLTTLGTANQLLRVNAGGTALEYFTPPWTTNTGTVTSVGLSLPGIFNVTGSPVTTSGTLTATLTSQTAKTFFAAPNAAAGTPSFRAILPSDLGTGTTDSTTFLSGAGTYLQILNDATTTTTTGWSSQKIQDELDAIGDIVAGGLVYKGGYNAATDTPSLDDGTPIPGIKTGWTYVVTTAGTFFTEPVEVGDMLIANIDNPTTLAHWNIINKNIPEILDASETEKGIIQLATQAEVNTGTNATKAVTPATLKTYLDANVGGYTQLFGNGTAQSFAISHGLNTAFVIVQVYEESTHRQVEVEVELTSTSIVTLNTNTIPTTNQYRVIIKK